MNITLDIITAAFLLMIAYTDYQSMEIPNKFLAALIICSIVSCILHSEVSVLERILGLFSVSVPMYLICLVIPDAFGGGDIKLTAIMGFYLGWKALLVGTYFGFLFGGIQAFILILTKKVRRGEGAHMAFGPALCSGMLIAIVWGIDLWNWYVG